MYIYSYRDIDSKVKSNKNLQKCNNKINNCSTEKINMILCMCLIYRSLIKGRYMVDCIGYTPLMRALKERNYSCAALLCLLNVTVLHDEICCTNPADQGHKSLPLHQLIINMQPRRQRFL